MMLKFIEYACLPESLQDALAEDAKSRRYNPNNEGEIARRRLIAFACAYVMGAPEAVVNEKPDQKAIASIFSSLSFFHRNAVPEDESKRFYNRLEKCWPVVTGAIECSGVLENNTEPQKPAQGAKILPQKPAQGAKILPLKPQYA